MCVMRVTIYIIYNHNYFYLLDISLSQYDAELHAQNPSAKYTETKE